MDVVNWLKWYKCETFVITTGFQSNVPQGLSFSETSSRFPASTDWYKSVDNPSVHYIGWLMHERDFRRSAGGFLSGFRYLIRNLAYHVREEDANIAYPVEHLTREEVIRKVVTRFQTADDIFLLQDGVALRDVIVPDDEALGRYLYYEGITHDFHPNLMARNDTISVYLMWGDGRTANTVFDSGIRYNDTKNLVNVLLHPAIQVGQLVRSVVEDVELEWGERFEPAIVKTITAALDGKIEKFEQMQYKPYQRSVRNQTKIDEYESPVGGGDMHNEHHEELMQSVWKAVYTGGRAQELAQVRAAAKKWLPYLYDERSVHEKQSVTVASE